MEHYVKGKNVEEAVSRDDIPIPDLPENYLWMQVNAGSKVRNLMTYATKAFANEGAVVWSGSGAAVGKTISCAEIMKRNHKDTHQITKICYRKVEEHWEPKVEDLDALVVVRELPMVHILLSKKPLNKDEPGYQPPGSHEVFWKTKEMSKDPNKRPASKQTRKPAASRVDPEQFAAMGLRAGSKRAKNNNDNNAKTKKANTEKTSVGKTKDNKSATKDT